jgi:hypothetical protein
MIINIGILLTGIFFVILLIPNSFAEEDWLSWGAESEISVSIIGNSIINLDSNNRLIRAYVDVVNFDPSDGRYLMKIIQPFTDKIISEKEIVIREKSNGEAGTDVAYMINDDDIMTNGTAILGDYSIEISTDKGKSIGGAIFSIVYSSELELTNIVEDNAEENLDKVDDLNEIEQIEEQVEETSEIENIQKIPDWVKNIFILYADGSITESELISALSFLIEQKIILVNQ